MDPTPPSPHPKAVLTAEQVLRRGNSARVAQLGHDLLRDVAGAVGSPITPIGHLPGGLNAAAVRVQLAGGRDAVLKAEPRTGPTHLREAQRAQRVVEHLRAHGYPTPAWLAVGETSHHVWQLIDFIDAAPAPHLTASIVEQLLEVVDLQAGLASEPHDHWAFAWRVVTKQEPVAGALMAGPPEVSALVERALTTCAGASEPTSAPDAVHADLNPSNVLVRGGEVVTVVDIGNAGSGTLATDLTTLVWHTFPEPLDDVRGRVWLKICDTVGWEQAAVLTATRVLMELEWAVRRGFDGVVVEVVERGHRALSELEGLR